MADDRLIVIASGKGGAGKSLVAANVGVFLATLGRRVVLVDASFGSASTHAFVGVRAPRHTVGEVLRGEIKARDAACATSVPGLELVSGRGDAPDAADPNPAQLEHLVDELAEIEADHIVVDNRSGTSQVSLDLLLAADVPVVVVGPEPTAAELTYRLLKAAFIRRLSVTHPEALGEIEAAVRNPLPTPLELYRAAGGETAAALADVVMSFSPNLVLNYARSKADMDLGLTLTSAVRRRLGLRARYVGHLEHDDAVWVALRRQRPLLIEHPEARISKCIEKVTRRLMFRSDSLPLFEELAAEPTYYQLLEVEPSATDEEIRRANRKMRADYSAESVVVSGLYSTGELEAAHAEFDRAYATLMDPAERKSYDLELFPDGIPQRPMVNAPTLPNAAPPPEERPPMPEVDPDTEFSGGLMRQIREARGLDLREIAEHTKIGMAYLDALENETWGKLPAVVYVRGFLTEYAKMLGLNREQVIESYMRRYTANVG